MPLHEWDPVPARGEPVYYIKLYGTPLEIHIKDPESGRIFTRTIEYGTSGLVHFWENGHHFLGMSRKGDIVETNKQFIKWLHENSETEDYEYEELT